MYNCDNNITEPEANEIENVSLLKSTEVKSTSLYSAEVEIINPNNDQDLLDLNNLASNSNYSTLLDKYYVNFKIKELPFGCDSYSFDMLVDGSIEDSGYLNGYEEGDVVGSNISGYYIENTLGVGTHTIKVKYYYDYFGLFTDVVTDTKSFNVYESIQGMHIDGPSSVPSGSYADFTAVLEGGSGFQNPTVYEWWVKRVSEPELERGNINPCFNTGR